jgi:hypothetical protein
MTSDHDALKDLISSTLSAIDAAEPELKPATDAPVVDTETSNSNSDEVDDILKKLAGASEKPQKKETDDMSGMLESLLSQDTILESMELLAVEMEEFLGNSASSSSLSVADKTRHERQLGLYQQLSSIYKDSPEAIEDPDSEQSKSVQILLDELHELGSPPSAVIEKLMMEQLSSMGAEGAESGDMVKEFEAFMKQAGSAGGLLPELTKDDEDMIKKLSEDPNALKDLMGGKNECVIS